MKRRNADTGKLRRPIKRTKITEGMYGNSMLYLKFIIVWASVVLADYMLEFRFEFLWPFWILLRSVYDTYKYQGLAFSVFFICIALTSDMICFFFIPIQYIFFAASTYVWVQFVWYTFADKGICLPTVAICCFIVYVEGVRGGAGGGWGARPLAAHCVGFPAVTLGVGVKKYVVRRLRARTVRLVRAQNDFYFELMREAVPPNEAVCECPVSCVTRHMNGAAGGKKRGKHEPNGHCVTDKSEHIEPPVEKEKKVARERDKSAQNHTSHTEHVGNGAASGPGCHEDEDKTNHCRGNGKSSKYDKKEANTLKEEKKEERKKNKKDKDKENSDSLKNTEHTKEQTLKDKEVESTKDSKNKEGNGSKEKENREREKENREREKETRDKERERDRERDREREKELREARESLEELKHLRGEVSVARAGEQEAKRALAAALAADKLRKHEHAQLKQAHAALQHKVSAWRAGAGAALERKLCEERRARQNAEHALLKGRTAGECCSSACAARRASAEAESAALRRDLTRARDLTHQLQRDCNHANHQVRSLEARVEGLSSSSGEGGAWGALAARAAHLERALSAETRVKLDLLSALGEANRKMHIQDSVINRQEKELEELKAQMLAVMPTDFVTPVSTAVSKLRLSDGTAARAAEGTNRMNDSGRMNDGSSRMNDTNRMTDGNSSRMCDGIMSGRMCDGTMSGRMSDGSSSASRSDGSPLDPNATVYTPKQLCLDA